MDTKAQGLPGYRKSWRGRQPSALRVPQVSAPYLMCTVMEQQSSQALWSLHILDMCHGRHVSLQTYPLTAQFTHVSHVSTVHWIHLPLLIPPTSVSPYLRPSTQFCFYVSHTYLRDYLHKIQEPQLRKWMQYLIMFQSLSELAHYEYLQLYPVSL